MAGLLSTKEHVELVAAVVITFYIYGCLMNPSEPSQHLCHLAWYIIPISSSDYDYDEAATVVDMPAFMLDLYSNLAGVYTKSRVSLRRCRYPRCRY